MKPTSKSAAQPSRKKPRPRENPPKQDLAVDAGKPDIPAGLRRLIAILARS